MIKLVGLTLHVGDVEWSREFYERLPGAVLVARRPGKFALLRMGEGLLGLLQSPRAGFHIEIDAAVSTGFITGW